MLGFVQSYYVDTISFIEASHGFKPNTYLHKLAFMFIHFYSWSEGTMRFVEVSHGFKTASSALYCLGVGECKKVAFSSSQKRRDVLLIWPRLVAWNFLCLMAILREFDLSYGLPRTYRTITPAHDYTPPIGFAP